LAEAVDVAVPAQALMLKWPNDLMLLGKKLGGILLERGGDRVAVGFGLNLASPPVLADRQAASLLAEMTPSAFAPLLAASFARLLDLWRQDSIAVLGQAWLARAHLPGTRLTVHTGPDETISGRFAGLEHDGALQLMRDDGTIAVVRAGDVVL
jgi:BirA family biotin operon repressor/biotin-[acetyl-CoA-carboxylase] ligase